MGIFDRMNRVIKSNLNSLLDHAEDPEKLISQTIVEMEKEIKVAKKELVTTLGTAKRLLEKAKEHEQIAQDWEDKAVLALREGDEELAREALRRKAVASADAHEAVQRANLAESSAQEMKSTLEQVENKVEDLKARKSTLASQVRKARNDKESLSTSSGTFGELDRLTGRIEQLEAEVETHDILDDPKRADVEARFRDLEKRAGSSQVEDELSALKSRLGDD